ncbi:MAG TPA: hypothetical protein VNS32_08650, partial [Flavisolibacter sp.]|nr:hypothetical protein [Flavisolibacter sp.]
MKKTLLLRQVLVIVSLLFSAYAFAQNAVISGKVSGNSQLLQGATVSVGTVTVTTNENGSYSLSVNPGN